MKRFSLFLSYAFAILGLFVILFFAIALPMIRINTLATVQDAASFRIPIYVLCYLILTLVLCADVCLILLLKNIRLGAIFTKGSVTLLRIISWAAIFAGVAAFPLTFLFYRGALFITFAALFLGFVLRVVKQVIEKAAELKEENDATI